METYFQDYSLFKRFIETYQPSGFKGIDLIDSLKKRKQGYHYYVGTDFSNFRYPDEEMLNAGNLYSHREIGIIRLIESGLQ